MHYDYLANVIITLQDQVRKINSSFFFVLNQIIVLNQYLLNLQCLLKNIINKKYTRRYTKFLNRINISNNIII